jgi:uncharacterized protein YqjF (DUF2071 family)
VNAPTLYGVMERRILVNYRVDPDTLAARLPAPFRPALVGGYGVAGICLIRLGELRLAGMPSFLGLTSENAAHRIAVEWDTPDGPRWGVYIPRRDTSSRLAVVAGGRLFPGRQHPARFRVQEGAGRYQVEVASRDGTTHVVVAAHVAPTVMSGSVFGDTDLASGFFRGTPVAYTATANACTFQGVELRTDGWSLRPLDVEVIGSSFFEDPARFPAGSVTLDSAFLMAGFSTSWHPKPALTGRQTESHSGRSAPSGHMAGRH